MIELNPNEFVGNLIRFNDCYLLEYPNGRKQKIIDVVENYFIVKKCDDITSYLSEDSIISSTDEFCVQDITFAKKGIFLEERCPKIDEQRRKMFGGFCIVTNYSLFYVIELECNGKKVITRKDINLSVKDILKKIPSLVVGCHFKVGRFDGVVLKSYFNDIYTFTVRGYEFWLNKSKLDEYLTEGYIERLHSSLYPKRRIGRFTCTVIEFLPKDRVIVWVKSSSLDFYREMSYYEFKTKQRIIVKSTEVRNTPTKIDTNIIEKPEWVHTASIGGIYEAMRDADIPILDIQSAFKSLGY